MRKVEAGLLYLQNMVIIFSEYTLFLAGLRLAVTGVGWGGAPLAGGSAALPDLKLGEIQGTRPTP